MHSCTMYGQRRCAHIVAKALFDLLGGDHDLRVVHAILVERPASVGAARQFKRGLDLIERR
jgi:hypothetical protein